jgi:DNA helicase-2/ATP-dependent DNA helicase PcrA
MTADLLSQLNPPQREAVTHPGGPLLIVAGAGTGKTRVITHRIAWLIRAQGVRPMEIFAATFTNKAADEMKSRAEELLGRPGLRLPIATFHSHCARFLRREAPLLGHSERFTIIDEADQLGLIREVIRGLGLRREDCPPPHAQWMINQAKIRMVGPEEFAQDLPRPEDEWVAQVYERYQRRLRESDAFDFEDLILNVVRLLERDEARRTEYQRRFAHVLVDEYQDTNMVQCRLVKLLTGEHGNLCVVGDEDQSIYSWRGADLNNILSFQQDHPGTTVVKLEQNYRSTGKILRAASEVISNNRERLGKTLWTDVGEGDPLEVLCVPNEHTEAMHVIAAVERLSRQGTSLNQIAIFYRINALSRRFEERLLEADIPHRVYGGVRFFERREIKDLLAHLQLAANPANSVALLRVINVPRRGVGDTTVRKISERAERMAREAGAERPGGLWGAMLALLEAGEIRGKAATGLRRLAEVVQEWRSASAEVALADLLEQILSDTGYIEFLRKSDPLTHEAREENIAELGNSLTEYEGESPDGGLEGYLEKVALESAADEYDAHTDRVSLMTAHNAKGLEFDVVFIVGLEESLFPSGRALDEGRALEEERRLFYVGLTRARRRIFLSWAQSRMIYRETRWNQPSRFLAELPDGVLEGQGAYPTRRAGIQKTVAPEPAWSSTGQLQTGQRVSHNVFGVGTILGTKGEGAMRKVVVRFESDELVELLERYAQLGPAEGGL